MPSRASRRRPSRRSSRRRASRKRARRSPRRSGRRYRAGSSDSPMRIDLSDSSLLQEGKIIVDDTPRTVDVELLKQMNSGFKLIMPAGHVHENTVGSKRSSSTVRPPTIYDVPYMEWEFSPDVAPPPVDSPRRNAPMSPGIERYPTTLDAFQDSAVESVNWALQTGQLVLTVKFTDHKRLVGRGTITLRAATKRRA